MANRVAFMFNNLVIKIGKKMKDNKYYVYPLRTSAK